MQSRELAAATQNANVEVFLNLSNAFAQGVDKLTRLNMEAIRSNLADTHDLSRKVLSMRDAYEWLTMQTAVIQPTAEKVQAYNRQLLDIMAVIQADCARCTQAHWDAYGEQTRTLVKDFAQSGANGSGPIVDALDSAITAARKLYETVQQTGQQAVEVSRSNIENAAMEASKTAKRAIEPITQVAKG
jgi:phasin family protein